MKRVLFPLLAGALWSAALVLPPFSPAPALLAQDNAHNSRNALDWPGVYRGVIPCGAAQCEGIEMFVTLRQNLTYQQEIRYLGKPGQVFNQAGTFVWNPAGSEITLKPNQGEISYFQVGENQLILLNAPGKPKGEGYRLQKIASVADTTPDASLTNTYWKLTELRGRPISPGAEQKREIHLILQTQNNRVQGFAGCNRFQGEYTLEEKTGYLRFSPLMTTKMACPALNLETEFLKALEMADSFSIKGDSFTLNKARMAPLAKFQAVYLR
ncbi:MAG: META domain-containing protein [Cyanobacteriota bacterium]|jgi:copper homeostasis protein (lipoprotein)